MNRPPIASFGRVWGAPLVLVLVTLASLVGALVVDDARDWIATLALAGVLAYAFGKGWRFNRA